MEQKLKEFKSRRRRENLLSKPKHMFFGLVNKISFKKDVSLKAKNSITTENEVFNNSRVSNLFTLPTRHVCSDEFTQN